MKIIRPKVSAWYRDSNSGDVFEVVAIDKESDSIEYQLLDGEMGEFDQATWESLRLKRTDAPDDWRTSLEDAVDDGFFADSELEPDQYSSPQIDYDRDMPDFDTDAYLA